VDFETEDYPIQRRRDSNLPTMIKARMCRRKNKRGKSIRMMLRLCRSTQRKACRFPGTLQNGFVEAMPQDLKA
jgi:hypothetical protein